MTVEEIKVAIPKLMLEERAELARCLHGWEDVEWAAQSALQLKGWAKTARRQPSSRSNLAW